MRSAPIHNASTRNALKMKKSQAFRRSVSKPKSQKSENVKGCDTLSSLAISDGKLCINNDGYDSDTHSNCDPPQLEMMPAFEDDCIISFSSSSAASDLLRPGKVLLSCPFVNCSSRFQCVIELVSHYRFKHCSNLKIGENSPVELKVFSCPFCIPNSYSTTTASSDVKTLDDHVSRYHGQDLDKHIYPLLCSIDFDSSDLSNMMSCAQNGLELTNFKTESPLIAGPNLTRIPLVGKGLIPISNDSIPLLNINASTLLLAIPTSKNEIGSGQILQMSNQNLTNLIQTNPHPLISFIPTVPSLGTHIPIQMAPTSQNLKSITSKNTGVETLSESNQIVNSLSTLVANKFSSTQANLNIINNKPTNSSSSNPSIMMGASVLNNQKLVSNLHITPISATLRKNFSKSELNNESALRTLAFLSTSREQETITKKLSKKEKRKHAFEPTSCSEPSKVLVLSRERELAEGKSSLVESTTVTMATKVIPASSTNVRQQIAITPVLQPTNSSSNGQSEIACAKSSLSTSVKDSVSASTALNALTNIERINGRLTKKPLMSFTPVSVPHILTNPLLNNSPQVILTTANQIITPPIKVQSEIIPGIMLPQSSSKMFVTSQTNTSVQRNPKISPSSTSLQKILPKPAVQPRGNSSLNNSAKTIQISGSFPLIVQTVQQDTPQNSFKEVTKKRKRIRPDLIKQNCSSRIHSIQRKKLIEVATAFLAQTEDLQTPETKLPSNISTSKRSSVRRSSFVNLTQKDKSPSQI